MLRCGHEENARQGSSILAVSSHSEDPVVPVCRQNIDKRMEKKKTNEGLSNTRVPRVRDCGVEHSSPAVRAIQMAPNPIHDT